MTIPRNKFIVITGLSGSGKSSLAFDTIYAEGQRRYVESLSSYARQFLGRMSKPECDFIKGLPPAIAIEQKVNNRNSRSTVGTSTEIYDYLRLLFARIGKTFSPVSGEQVKKHTTADVINAIKPYPDGTRFAIVTQIILPEGPLICHATRRLADKAATHALSTMASSSKSPMYYPRPTIASRMITTCSSTAWPSRTPKKMKCACSTRWPQHSMRATMSALLIVGNADGTTTEQTFSKRFEADGMTFQEPTDLMFNFNNPIGACPTCEGFGKVVGIDEKLVIPNKSLSVYDDAVMCWRGQVMSEWKEGVHPHCCKTRLPHPHTILPTHPGAKRPSVAWMMDEFPGIDGFFEWIKSKSYYIQYRVLLARYRGKTTAPPATAHDSRPMPAM